MIFHEYVLRFVKAPHPKELAILLEDGTIAFYPPEGVWIPISEELARFIRRERPGAHLIRTDFVWKVYAAHHPGLIGQAEDLLPDLFAAE
jgi:hypothetical protein